MARCRGRNEQGEPCGAPESFVNPSGWCPAHQPGGRERLREAGRLGAEVSKQVRRKWKGLRPGELGPLRTPKDAERWLRIIGQAVTEGRLRNRDADAGTRAGREWLCGLFQHIKPCRGAVGVGRHEIGGAPFRITSITYRVFCFNSDTCSRSASTRSVTTPASCARPASGPSSVGSGRGGCRGHHRLAGPQRRGVRGRAI